MTQPKAQNWHPYHYEDYALLPADGRVWELIDGEFYVNPAPVSFHQTVSRRLQHRLMSILEDTGLAHVFNAPTDVILGPITTVQPDLAIVAAARKHTVSVRGIEGPPDIVVEILSPSNRAYDEALKRNLYQRAGVPEYWIVDPQAHTIEVLRLELGVYLQQTLLGPDDTLRSVSFDGLINVSLASIFAPL